MQIIRKIFLFFTTLTFIALLFATASSWTANQTIQRRETVKAWLSESGSYEHFVDEAARQVEAQQNKEPKNPSEDPSKIDTASLRVAAEKAFSPSFLKTNLELVLDGTYDWLEGKNPQLNFNLDLSSAKNVFADELGKVALAKAASLPVCQTAVVTDFDPLSATCIPAGVNFNAEVDKFVAQFKTNKEILPDPVITADLIKVGDESNKQRIDQAYPSVPKWYKMSKNAPWALIGLSVLWAGLVMLFSASKRFGVKHLAKAFVLTSVSIAVGALVLQPGTDFLTNKILESSNKSNAAAEGASQFFEKIGVPLVAKINESTREWGLIFAAIYGFIGLALIILLLATKKHNHQLPKPEEHNKHHEPSDKLPPAIHPESVEATKLVEPKGPPEVKGKSVQG